VDHALPLQRDGFGKDRGRIDGIDEIDRAVEVTFGAFQADDFRHQLHQSAIAAVGIAFQRRVAAQHAGRGNGVVRAAHHVQSQAQLAYTGFAGTQPAEQRSVLGVVVQAVGGKTEAHVRSDEGGATSLA